jgi:hypothetical protein
MKRLVLLLALQAVIFQVGGNFQKRKFQSEPFLSQVSCQSGDEDLPGMQMTLPVLDVPMTNSEIKAYEKAFKPKLDFAPTGKTPQPSMINICVPFNY